MAYIDRDKLLKDIEESVVFTVRGQNSLEVKGANKITDRIKQMPTADVVEVKYGEWKKHRDDGDCEYIECSVCRQEFYPPNNEFEFDYYPKYCQECGAKMDRKEVD